MKQKLLVKNIMLVIALDSSIVAVSNATDYPSADYQSKVVYTNPDYKETPSAANTGVGSDSAKASASSNYPAADFAPKVVYNDSSSPASSVEPVEADKNYPATNFQPKVLFSDPNYKHCQTLPASPSVSAKSLAENSSESVAVENKSSSSDSTSLIALIAVAAIGFFFYSKKSGVSVSKAANSIDVVSASGETGVEKYLQRAGMNKTGVAKYLEKQSSNPSTGVAKYIAKQVIKDREAAASKVTGVEKYLRENK